MTGFGRGDAADGTRTVSAEIKSVNHRYGEFSVRIARKYQFAEEAIKKTVRTAASRGKIDISINVLSSAEDESAVSINLPAARQYFKGLRELQSALDVSGDITLELLAGLPDVLKAASPELDEDAILAVILAAVTAAAADFNAMRAQEGSKLAEDLILRADVIENRLCEIEARAPQLTAIYAEKLRERITELLVPTGIEISEDRIAAETALFADKSNITEEIVRLHSHLIQLRNILKDTPADVPVGKKLDFLVQEMNREANTIGSKANDLKTTDFMLEMKSEIEKIREQIQNIE
jgi:uncharacterized protein (TIGR00255 family)